MRDGSTMNLGHGRLPLSHDSVADMAMDTMTTIWEVMVVTWAMADIWEATVPEVAEIRTRMKNITQWAFS